VQHQAMWKLVDLMHAQPSAYFLFNYSRPASRGASKGLPWPPAVVAHTSQPVTRLDDTTVTVMPDVWRPVHSVHTTVVVERYDSDTSYMHRLGLSE
jgi:hypothetical protein